MCVGCGSEITDQYVLRVAPDLEWHAACLKCADCHQTLDENCTCFVRDGKTYCKHDYHRYWAGTRRSRDIAETGAGPIAGSHRGRGDQCSIIQELWFTGQGELSGGCGRQFLYGAIEVRHLIIRMALALGLQTPPRGLRRPLRPQCSINPQWDRRHVRCTGHGPFS